MCGERECIDKKEIDEYFAKNLTIEVLITSEEKDKPLDLVNLNLESDNQEKRGKDKNLKRIKLSKEKKYQKKKLLRKKLKKQRKIAKLKLKKEKKINKIKKKTFVKKKNKQIKLKQEIKVNKANDKNICYIIDKCDIEDISKHLIEIGKKKDYPDITKN
tara:strand:- start:16 stop:492 length:477 start_codon:yes stop_codon:yes gene_type:complete